MSFQTINPATGETLRTFPMASDAEVATALKTADDRYNNDWKLRPVAARAQIELSAAIPDYYADRAGRLRRGRFGADGAQWRKA